MFPPAPDAAKVRRLPADLNNDDPATRDKASDELAKLGPLVEVLTGVNGRGLLNGGQVQIGRQRSPAAPKRPTFPGLPVPPSRVNLGGVAR
jgi:hypothetical protein